MSDDAFVEVTGHGSAVAPPDQARINFAAVGRGAQLSDAFESATGSLTQCARPAVSTVWPISTWLPAT